MKDRLLIQNYHNGSRNLAIVFLFITASPTFAEGEPWFHGFFVEGSGLYYFAPGPLEEFLRPELGFRGALGYEFHNFRFAVESGYSYITGTNPLVLNIAFVPLVFKFGYHWQFYSMFGLQADLGVGMAFSHTVHYNTALDMVTDTLSEKDETSFFSGLRLYITITPLRFLKIYAGGGIDAIFETDGTIPLPLVEIGILIKPFILADSIATAAANRARQRGEITGVWFARNSVAIDEEQLAVLDEAGHRLAEDSSLHLTLRGYYAPKGTQMQVRHANNDPALSVARVYFCIEYLRSRFGIDSSRITIEYRNAGRRENLYSCVEIILR